VFKSIVGLHWYLRLRGHEIDNIDFGRKSFGQQYALGQKTSDIQELSRLLMKLCEKTGRRLRGSSFVGGGIHLWLNFENRMYWAQGYKLKKDVYSTQDIFLAAQRLLNTAAIPARVTNIGVTVFNLHPANPEQLGLFDDSRLDTRSLARAADMVNDRYGEFTIVPAIMANMQDVILKRVAFGGTGDN
jgi:DNA polymerase-4